MPLDIRPLASPEMVQGYETAASLAEARYDQTNALGGKIEARAWRQVADYCRGMAISRARDDDQFKFQRDRDRHRREIPMAPEDMGMQGLFNVESALIRRLEMPEWKREMYYEIVELALGYLSPMQRVVFELVAGEMMTIPDVAEALQADPREIRQHLGRARRKMKNDVAPRVKRLLVILRRKIS